MTSTIKRGIILMNLGSPDSTELKDVKKYLTQFLMDKRVIDYPYLLRKLVVSGIIVPFRTANSAEAYKTIWTSEGSPLVNLTRQLQQALQQQVEEPVVIAMRYGNPSMADAYARLLQLAPGLEEVIAIPLYPHYAMSSFETAVEWAREVHHKKKYPFRLTFVKPFYNDSDYIDALSDSIRPYLQQPYDHMLFSFHGIPKRHILKGDITGHHCLQTDNCCQVSSPAHTHCYRHQCLTTARLVAEKLDIPANKWSHSFQSRLGREEWLKPYTDFRLLEFPGEGVKKLLVVCPAFVSDCLETLEEIAERGKDSFLEAGGESFTAIPCLNLHPQWVTAIEGWIKEFREGNYSRSLESEVHV